MRRPTPFTAFTPPSDAGMTLFEVMIAAGVTLMAIVLAMGRSSAWPAPAPSPKRN